MAEKFYKLIFELFMVFFEFSWKYFLKCQASGEKDEKKAKKKNKTSREL